MGWFGDLLKNKLNIEIQLERYQLFGYEGDGYSFVQDADLYSFLGEMSYYEAVREGKLKDLEGDIKKYPDVYSKYTNAINHIKKDTYRHTGKKGVFGIPIWLESFEDSGRERYCISIPSAAKNPEKAMDLITYSASDEGIMNIAFGPEGQMWKQENGNYVLLQDWYQIYEELQEPDEKFVETNHGKEDFHRAICKIELVGNEALGRKLIGEKSREH